MPRVYRKAKSKRPEVNPAVWSWLCDENPDEVDEDRNFSWKIFELHEQWINSRGGNGSRTSKHSGRRSNRMCSPTSSRSTRARAPRAGGGTAHREVRPEVTPTWTADSQSRGCRFRALVVRLGEWDSRMCPGLNTGSRQAGSALTRRTRRSSKAKRTICGVTDCSPHMNCGLSRQKISSPNARRFQTIKF